MADIFLSYSSEDRDDVVPLVQALQEDGFSVWWDRDIRPGPSFDREIEQAIESAGCMVVVWSSRSVESEWVRSEVEEGARLGILVPVMIEAVMPPLAYRRRQSADLSDWDGERTGGYEQLVTGIRATMAGKGNAVAVERPETAHGGATRLSKRRRGVAPGLAATTVIIAAALAGAGGWLLAGGYGGGSEMPPGVARLQLNLPAGTIVADGIASKINITPDGQTITYVARGKDFESAYFSRRLDTLGSNPVNTPSSNLGSHWLSADGKWLVFNDVDSASYRKTTIAGGPATTIAPIGQGPGGIRGLSWSRDGQIAFASDGPGIVLVPAGGGTPTALTTPEEGVIHGQPHFTRDSSALLFTASGGIGDTPSVKIIDLSSGEIRTLVDGDRPRLTSSGHLLVVREGALWGAAFDAASGTIVGEPIVVLDGLDSQSPDFAVADNGTLVYVPELPDAERAVEVVWASPEGQVEPLNIALNGIEMPRVSPDGENILLHALSASQQASIWNYSLPKETTTKLTFDEPPMRSLGPAWGPSGDRFAYLRFDGGNKGVIYLGAADGATAPVALTQDLQPGPAMLTPDGREIITLHCNFDTGNCDLARVSTEQGDDDFQLLLETPFEERAPELSPDGRWLAYSSDESGQHELYVRPYPDLESGRWQVSTAGGELPLWSKDGSRLFFVQRSSNELMEVTIAESDGFNWSAPVVTMNLETYDWGAGGTNQARNYDISNDGKRFLLVRQSNGVERLVVVLNWLEELKQLVPVEQG